MPPESQGHKYEHNTISGDARVHLGDTNSVTNVVNNIVNNNEKTCKHPIHDRREGGNVLVNVLKISSRCKQSWAANRATWS
jgi:hypothetical protein